jgi:hypothetical protein
MPENYAMEAFRGHGYRATLITDSSEWQTSFVDCFNPGKELKTPTEYEFGSGHDWKRK